MHNPPPGARKAPPAARRASPARVGGARVAGRRVADGNGRPAVLTTLGSGEKLIAILPLTILSVGSVAGLAAIIDDEAASAPQPADSSAAADPVPSETAAGQLPSGVGQATLGVESMREFKILTSNYSAEYGRAAGANIVAISKSGSNRLHGSLFEYHRNDALDSRNFFDRSKPDFKRNQFGFSLGGPIVRDKIFFFGSYEALREDLGLTQIASVPTVAV